MAALYKATILLLIASLSPASAGAFSSPFITTHHAHHVTDTGVTKHQHRTPQTVSMKSTASPIPLPLSTILFPRGGQQQDEYTASMREETDLDSEVQKTYGTQSDEESAGSVEMMEKSSTMQVDDSSVSDAAVSKSHFSMTAVAAPLAAVLQSATSFYTKQLSARPIFTKSATAAIIFGLSDYCAQLIERDEEKKEPIIFSRILTAFLVGLLFFGPAANAWYEMIFKVLPSTSLVSTLQKAALGQIFFGPTFTCVFFGAGMIESGTFSLGGWWNKIKNDLPAVWASGLGFWPLVDFISYKVVPVQWIPLFVNFCSFVWTIYLSIVANKSKTE